MLSLHEHALADMVSAAWAGPFHHSYEMPARRGSSARWVEWHSRQKLGASPEQWRCCSLADAAEQYAWDEIILDQQRHDGRRLAWTSDECRDELALSHTDVDRFYEASLQTLRWGKVGRTRNGKEDSSVVWLKAARDRGSIVDDILEAVSLLNGDENPEDHFCEAQPMNSAMTKVYAFADASRRLAIYDGRVGAALALFAMEYWHARDGELPLELRFAFFDSQTPGKSGSRNPSIGRHHFPILGKHNVHARWMWSAGRILNEAASRAGCNVLQLERALFMIGYDVRRAKLRYAS
ncbi:hypothetical protein [Bradyrhizobium canariense]|uniref:hypothetical protein n=1 Tax=Bradyrhizobium canariense TaxID=255045 RepID=UPI001178C109|nr:hypothetical protein [Bradyrhizobium canariense]